MSFQQRKNQRLGGYYNYCKQSDLPTLIKFNSHLEICKYPRMQRRAFTKKRVILVNTSLTCERETKGRFIVRLIIHSVFLTQKSGGGRLSIDWQAGTSACQPANSQVPVTRFKKQCSTNNHRETGLTNNL